MTATTKKTVGCKENCYHKDDNKNRGDVHAVDGGTRIICCHDCEDQFWSIFYLPLSLILK